MKQLLSVPFQLWVLRVQHGFGITQWSMSCSSSEATCQGLEQVRPLPCGGNLSLPLWIAAFESLASNPGSQAQEMLFLPPRCSATRQCCIMPLVNGLCLRTYHGTIISWGLVPNNALSASFLLNPRDQQANCQHFFPRLSSESSDKVQIRSSDKVMQGKCFYTDWQDSAIIHGLCTCYELHIKPKIQ